MIIILGSIEVKQSEYGIFISQESYAREMLKRFNMDDVNPVGTPMGCRVKSTKQFEGKKVDSKYFKSLVES